MWFSRIQDILLESGPHVLVQAEDEWGLPYVLDAIGSSGSKVIYVELGESDAGNTTRLGNRLSDAVFRATGTRLFGLGVPVHYGLNLLEQNQGYFEPAITVIKNPEFGNELRNGLLKMASSRFRLIEIVQEAHHYPDIDSHFVITRSDLAVRYEEAMDMFGDHLSERDITSLLETSGGAYTEFVNLANRTLSLPPPSRPLLGGGEESSKTSHRGPALVEYLVREGRWIEAFELAVRTSNFAKAASMIHYAGEAYFESGLFTNFWIQLRALPEDVFHDDVPAFWLLSAAIAVDKQEDVRDFLWRQLETRKMPNLRALRATTHTNSGSIREAEVAFSNEKSVMTVRAMALLLTHFGRPNEGLRIALDNLEDLERRATPRELASYSYSISKILLFLGRHSAAHEWVSWGLRIYYDARLKEELLRISLLSAKAYYALLLGDADSCRTTLASVSLDVDLAGIPSMDAMFSTAGDLALVSGDFDRALELYNVNFEESGRETIGYYLADVVGAMIMQGRVEQAVALANESLVLAAGTHERNVALTKLAVGIANSKSGLREARDQLSSSINDFSKLNDSVSLTRASLHLAQLYWRERDTDRAMQVMFDAREHLAELGLTGWQLLGLPTSEILDLWSGFNEDDSVLQLHFLGRRIARIDGDENQLSLRNAEILALIAAEPKGLTGEQLLLRMYGEGGTLSTLKASVSKLRQMVPISSRPYLIDTRFEADHVIVLRLIADGRVAEALDMYQGPLLPGSEAPGILKLREIITESLRQAVIGSGDRSLMLKFVELADDDLEALETLKEMLQPEDPHYSSVAARVAQIRRDWELGD